MRVIRAAVNIGDDNPGEIEEGVRELLEAVCEREVVKADKIRLFLVSATRDITTEYPCRFIREQGFPDVPLLCVQEMYVKDSLPLTIRFMIQIDEGDGTGFVYLRDTCSLRG